MTRVSVSHKYRLLRLTIFNTARSRMHMQHRCIGGAQLSGHGCTRPRRFACINARNRGTTDAELRPRLNARAICKEERCFRSRRGTPSCRGKLQINYRITSYHRRFTPRRLLTFQFKDPRPLALITNFAGELCAFKRHRDTERRDKVQDSIKFQTVSFYFFPVAPAKERCFSLIRVSLNFSAEVEICMPPRNLLIAAAIKCSDRRRVQIYSNGRWRI